MTTSTSVGSVAAVSAVPVWPRRLAIGSVLGVAGTVFALSFVAISEVAVTVGAVNPGMGWLVPIAIDGGIIAGCATLWAQALEARRSWRSSLFVAVLLGLSVWVNVEHTDGALLARVIAGSPPVILFGALELVADQFLRSARTHSGQVDHCADRPVDRRVVAEDPEDVAPVATGATAVATGSRVVATGPTGVATRATDVATGSESVAPGATDTATRSEVVATRARDVATGRDGGDGLATAAPTVRQVDLAGLVVAGEGLGATERARRAVDAYVAAGGDIDDDGLAQAVAEQVGCSVRTVQRVIARIRDRPRPSPVSGSGRDRATGVATGVAHRDNGRSPADLSPGVGW